MRVGIFGAGQAGRMAVKWIPSNQNVTCFIDNNKEKHNTYLDGVIICHIEEALKMQLDIIWIAVLNKEASIEIEKQLENAGYQGEVIKILDVRERQSIRLAGLRLIAEEIKKRNVVGDIAELGVYQGDFAREMNRLFPDRRIYLFDTFDGFSEKDIVIEHKMGNKRVNVGDFSNTCIEEVQKELLYPEQAIFCQGYFPNSLTTLGKEELISQFALVSLDPDLYEPVYQGLEYFYPRLAVGGVILIHDYNSIQFPGVKKAVERYCYENDLYVVPLMDIHGTAVLIKQK